MALGGDGDGEHAPNRPQGTIESQFPGTPHPFASLPSQLATGHQQAQGNGEVEGWSFLAQVGGGQVHHHPGQRHLEAAVAKGGAHPLPRLLHGRIGQSHHLQARQPRGQIHFHKHRPGLQALQRRRLAPCQHHALGHYSVSATPVPSPVLRCNGQLP